MYIVIIGCGRIGGTLAQELSNEGHDVVIIDKEKSRLEALGSGFNGIRLRGVEFDHDILMEAGIEQAEVFLAMTPDDNVNLMASQVALRLLGVKRVIARVCDPQKQFLYDQLGIETICPTSSASQATKEMILHANYQLHARIREELEIIELIYLSEKVFNVQEIQFKYQCTLLGIIRNGKLTQPRPSMNVQKGDRLIVSIFSSESVDFVRAIGGSK